jgi:hypothetical protein
MKPDHILEETWRIKDELARESDYDIRKLFENLRAYERAHPELPRIRRPEDLRRLAQKTEDAAVAALNDAPGPQDEAAAGRK